MHVSFIRAAHSSWRPSLHCLAVVRSVRQFSGTASKHAHEHNAEIKKTRNIGIIAHIDAVGVIGFLEEYILMNVGQNDHDRAYALLQWHDPPDWR